MESSESLFSYGMRLRSSGECGHLEAPTESSREPTNSASGSDSKDGRPYELQRMRARTKSAPVLSPSVRRNLALNASSRKLAEAPTGIPVRTATKSTTTTPRSRSSMVEHGASAVLSKAFSAPSASQRLVTSGAIIRDCTSPAAYSKEYEREALIRVENLGAKSVLKTPKSHVGSRFAQRSLKFASFGESWAVDVFSLPHNALRRDLIDLYDILESMFQRKRALDAPLEVSMVFEWLRVFRNFLLRYFECEEQIVFPWIESRCIVMADMSRAVRLGTKAHLAGMLQAMFRLEAILAHAAEPDFSDVVYKPSQNGSARLAMSRSTSDARRSSKLRRRRRESSYAVSTKVTSDMIPFILGADVDRFVTELDLYLRQTAESMEPLIAGAFSQQDKEALDKRVIEFWWSGPQRRSNMCVLSFWIFETYGDRLYQSWKYDQVGIRRSMQIGLYEKFHVRHLSIPRMFRRYAMEFANNMQPTKPLELPIPGNQHHPGRSASSRSSRHARSSNGALADVLREEGYHTDLSWARYRKPMYPALRYPMNDVEEEVERMLIAEQLGRSSRKVTQNSDGLTSDGVLSTLVDECGDLDDVAKDVGDEYYVSAEEVDELLSNMRQNSYESLKFTNAGSHVTNEDNQQLLEGIQSWIVEDRRNSRFEANGVTAREATPARAKTMPFERSSAAQLYASEADGSDRKASASKKMRSSRLMRKNSALFFSRWVSKLVRGQNQ